MNALAIVYLGILVIGLVIWTIFMLIAPQSQEKKR